MPYARDDHVIVAGDLAPGVFFGRAYSTERQTWQSVHLGVNFLPSTPNPALSRYRLWAVTVQVKTAILGVKTGVRLSGYILLDVMGGEDCISLFDTVQSSSGLTQWSGDAPFSCGFQWRIAAGGVVATDIVCARLLYERP